MGIANLNAYGAEQVALVLGVKSVQADQQMTTLAGSTVTAPASAPATATASAENYVVLPDSNMNPAAYAQLLTVFQDLATATGNGHFIHFEHLGVSIANMSAAAAAQLKALPDIIDIRPEQTYFAQPRTGRSNAETCATKLTDDPET